ncbi:unnamed protein product [Symbiodinium pilosum]|uniref:Uncharacterized protein n=1 Tax=Symbiodinium pilosum TaxID=2952 RepID=A0A812MUA9_SYMPI|nr:unnamed protein product [Symbiodinium pilosum]
MIIGSRRLQGGFGLFFWGFTWLQPFADRCFGQLAVLVPLHREARTSALRQDQHRKRGRTGTFGMLVHLSYSPGLYDNSAASIPTALLAATSPPLSPLASMAQEQLLNIGHGLTIKTMKDNGGRHGTFWGLKRLKKFFRRPLSPSLVPFGSEVPDISIQIENGAAGEADLEAGACETFTLPPATSLSWSQQKSGVSPAQTAARRRMSRQHICSRRKSREPVVVAALETWMPPAWYVSP